MPNANDIAEQVKLLTSLDTARSLRELNRDLANLTRQTRTNPSSSAGSQDDPAQVVGEDGLTDADRFGLATIDDLYKGFDLTQDQAYASRLSGELEATIEYKIDNKLRKAQLASGGELTPEVAGLTRAREILAQQADEFRATAPEAVDFRTIPEERRKDLASPDGFKGNLLKAGATALAGIPGLAGIAASALGFEDTGQALGGIASDIREAAPTDIGSSAASQLSSEIIRRAGLEQDDPERLSLGEASREIAKLALTDGDFAADLLGSTVGATAGGGIVRAGASGAARLTGLAGTRAGQAVGRAAGTSAGQAAPAIGVGLGSGVDENLTTEQAQLLAGTGAASAGIAGLTGALGGQVVESALGNLGRAITGRGAQATAQAADDLTVATGRQIAGNAARQLPASAAGEAAQEFVESGGEALGEFSQEQGTGVLETLASPDARRQGLAAGATGAAIGGIVGAGASAPSSVAGDLRSNRVNRAETARRADNAAALKEQKRKTIAANRQAEVARIQAQNDELNAAAQFADAANQNVVNQAEAREAARVAREEAIESRREQLRAPVAPDPNVDREALSVAELNRLERDEAEGVPQTLTDFVTNTAAASSTLREFLADGDLETDFRALYRNEFARKGAELDPDQEEAFINAIQNVVFEELTPAEIGPVIEQAAQDAELSENIEAARTQRQQDQEAADLERVEQARLASEAAAQEEANAETEANLTSRNEAEQARVAQEEADTQAAQAIVSEAFTNSVASIPAVTGLDTSPAQRNSARLPTIDNTLVAAREQGDGSAQALDVIDLQNQLVEQASTGVPRQVFKQLATNSGFNDSQSTAFGMRMALALRDNQTTAQLIETAERYQSVLRDGTLSVGPITGADIREQFLNVIRSFPGARETFRQEGDRGLLVRDSERDALVQEATQARIQRGLNLDPEVSAAIQESISLLETASTQTEPLSAEQAAEILNARDLLQYEVEQARSEAAIRRQASARQGVNTRARNAAAREERNTDTDFSDDLDTLDSALDPASEIESSSSQTRGDRFFTGAGDGNVTVREDQAETLRNYTSNRSPIFQEFTPKERQSFSGTVTRARKKIRDALKKEGPLTPAEAKGVLDAVEDIDRTLAAKKPSALAEGQTNSASESRAIPTPTQEQVSEQSDRDSSGADKAAELTVPDRVVFNPSADPDLVDARDIPDQELTQVKKDSVSGGKQEGKFQSNDDRKEAFDSVGYEGNSNDNLSPAAIDQIFETYSRSIPKIGVMESVTNYLGAHFRGAVALSDNLFFGSKKRPLRSTRARIARILAHELGHASHSLLGDVLNSDPEITAELAPRGPVEDLLYRGLRERVEQAQNPDAKFFNYVLSANEMLAEFNVFRFNNPELAQQRAPALTAALGSVENAENLIIARKSFPGLLGRPQPLRRRLSSSRNPDNSIEVFKRTDALEESNPERDSISLISSRPYTRQRVLAARAASIGQTPTGVRRYMARIAGSRRSREAAGKSSVFSNIDLQAVERSALLALEGRLPINRVRTSRTTPVTVGVARTPTSQGLLPRASQSEAPRQFSTSDVDTVVTEIMSNWGKKPRVVIVESTSDLPAELQTGATVAGITDGSTAYLVADQFIDNDHIAATLAEELFHKGLSKSLGLNYNSRLDSVFRARGRVPGLLKLAREYGSSDLFEINYADVIAAAQAGNKEAQRELTDEVLARIAQSPDLPTGVVAQLKQIQSRIKRYVQRFFPQAWQDSVTLADIHLMIREANNAGRDNDYQGPVRVRAARSSKPGDYYVLDKDGNKQVKHFYTGETSPAPELVRDTKELATRAWTSLSDKTRSGGLRDAIYKSTPWEKLMISMANGKFLIERVETELRRATSKQVNKMMEDLRSEEVPELVSKIFAKYTNESQDRALMSINSAITRYASAGQYKARAGGLAVNENGDSMAEVIGRVGEALTAIQAYFDLSPEQAQSQLSRYSNALHASERNDISWLMNADLQDSESTAERRLLRAEAAREGWSPALLNELRTLVEENAIDAREDYVGSGMSDAQAAEVLSDLRQNEQGAALLQEAHEKIQELIQATNEVKRQTGSFSNSYQAAIDAFGWKNYVPLRGPGIDPDEDIGSDFASAGFNTAYSETIRAVQGRRSLVEDVVETVQILAVSAVEQNTFQEVMESVVAHNVGTGLDSYTEVFQRDGSGGKRFEGTIEQLDINSPTFKNRMADKDLRRFVYYNSDNQGARLQTALVVTFARKEDAEALVGIKNDTADKLEAMLHEFKPFAGYSIPQATQFMASLKTSRNPPFIPFDALRNMFTLGLIASTEEGLTGLNAYIRQFTQPGLGNYTRDITKYVRLYQSGDRKGLQDLVANDGPGSTVAELDEFFRLGGPTSFLAALRDSDPNALSNLTGLASRANRAEVALKKLDNALITANVVADTLSRFAFYKALKDQGVDPRVAAARAKNTANFEQRGSFSGPLGGVLEFFRPTATGASALINSTLTGKYGPHTMAAGFGAGVILYSMASLMAGVDDEGEDVLANVNGKLYNNNFVFQYGDEPGDRVQVGIGFGPVASAISSGAQVARFMWSHQSINDTVDNVTGAIAGQAALVPLSQISPTENPTGFVANSVTPSLLKPIFEVGRNLNSLGIPIRSEFPGSDAEGLTGSFEGRLGSEQEMYDAVTQSLRNAGIADINPDNFKHLMRSYASGITYLMETMYENVKYATSDEEFIYNKKAGLYPFRQFVGSEFSQTPQDFYNHYNRVGALKTLIKRYEQAGREDKAEEIRQLPIYAENISDYDAAFKALRNVNKPYRPTLKLDETSTAEARRANRQRNKDRDAIYKKYLKAVES